MKSIKILSGGFLTEIPIINDELVKQNNELLESNKNLYDSKTFNLTLPKLNTMKQLAIYKALVDEYQNEIEYDTRLSLSYEKDINSIVINQSIEKLFNKYSELKKIKSKIAKFCSDIEEKNDLLRIQTGRTLTKEENKKLEKLNKIEEEYTKQLSMKIALESELEAGEKLLPEEITILEDKFKCKKEISDKKETIQKSNLDKQKILDRIISFIDDNLDIDKLNAKLQEYKEKDKSITLLLDQNDKYKLFINIINYLNEKPIYADADTKKEKNIATYPGVEDIKCDGLDFGGKFIGWFIAQKNKILKEYGKEVNDKKIAEYCSKIELVNDLKNINITDGDYKGRYNKFNYDLLIKENYKNYENIFDILVGYSSWSDNNFAGLYEKKADGTLKNFIIYEKNSVYIPSKDISVILNFEIFRSHPKILPDDNIYEFNNSTYQFTLSTTKIENIENKEIVYPVFSKPIIKSEFIGSLIDGLIVYSNFKEIDKLLRYYKNIFEIKIFDKWINKYGVFLDNIQFIPHMSSSILNIFILANSFNVYFNILLHLNYMIGYLDEERNISIITEDENINENPEYLKIISSINITDYTEYIEEVKSGLTSIKNLKTEDENIIIDKIFELLKTIIIKHKTIEIEGLILIINKLTEIDIIKPLIYNLINSFIFIFLKINDKKSILTNTYNFSKLNFLFSLFKKDFNDQGKFNSRMVDFNSFINLSKNQVFALFFIELVDEAMCFFKTWWIPNYQMNSKHREIADKTIETFNKKCLLNIVASFYFLQIYDNPKISSLINYKSQFINFNKVLGQMEQDNIKKCYIKSGLIKPKPTGNEKIFNDLYNSILSKVSDGFKLHSYTENKLQYSFDDPRGIESHLTKAGRPMCGEVTIMNLLNYILFNEKTKSIDFNYLPEITTRENTVLTNFYKKYSNVLEYNKNEELIDNFFKLLLDIPFAIIPGIDDRVDYYGKYDRDYGDHNVPCVYRYNTVTTVDSSGKTFIKNGTELRVTYFNLLRILSFILKLDGNLELRYIELNKDDNAFIKTALKEILNLFRNPNIEEILKSYELDFEKEEPLYSYYSPVNVKLRGANISLASHSVFSLSTSGKNFRKIKKNLKSYETILNKIPYTKEKPVDIYSSIFFAIFKENNIYSEINFNYLPEEYIIKFLNILHIDFDNLYIPSTIFSKLIEFKKTNIIKIFFDKFNLGKKSYSEYLVYMTINKIEIDINDFLKRYFQKFTILTNTILTTLIYYYDIELIKSLIATKQNNLEYDLWSIKTQEMFDLLDSQVKVLFKIGNKTKFYYGKIFMGLYIDKPINFEFIHPRLFLRIIEHNPSFFRMRFFENMNNNTNNFFNKLAILTEKEITTLFPSDIIFENIESYELLTIIKKKFPFYIENEKNLGILISNNFRKLFDGKDLFINNQLNRIDLLCYAAEINRSLFLEKILCEIIDIKTKLGYTPFIKSERHIYSEYLNHKFYDKFSYIFNNLNIFSSEYANLCEPIFNYLVFNMKTEILNIKFKSIKKSSEIELAKKIIEDYPKLYTKNIENYSSNMFKLYGTSYLIKFKKIYRKTITMFTTEFIFKSHEHGYINDDILLSDYKGTDEFTNYLIKIATRDKVNGSRLFFNILDRYTSIGYDNNLNRLSILLIKIDTKYTKEYISKNFIKLLNTLISRIDDSTPLNIYWQGLIKKFFEIITIEDKFLIKCIKNIISADKLILPDKIHVFKRILDSKIKEFIIKAGHSIDKSNIKSMVKILNNADLTAIVTKLDMR